MISCDFLSDSLKTHITYMTDILKLIKINKNIFFLYVKTNKK